MNKFPIKVLLYIILTKTKEQVDRKTVNCMRTYKCQNFSLAVAQPLNFVGMRTFFHDWSLRTNVMLDL